MKIKTAFALTLMVFSTCALAASKGKGVVFPLGKGADLLNQCSRETPVVNGFWVPTAAHITELEDGFDAAATAALKARQINFPQDGYDRQYVGIISNGQRFIYINAFIPEAGTFGFAGSSAQDFWRSNAIQMCDGGPYFFGALYEPATRKFSGFSFNATGR